MKLLKQLEENDAHEAEIMKNVKGWKVGESMYSKRWLPPIHLPGPKLLKGDHDRYGSKGTFVDEYN